MAFQRTVLLAAVAGWCAIFAATSVDATLADPTMWILVHHFLKNAREDPIVSPSKVSSHTHSFVGANGVSAFTTTAEDLEKESTCTTSGIGADMSAYWAPTLYSFNANNDTFDPRPLGYVNTYYLMRGNVPITAFPKGMQLLAGNAMRTGMGPTTQADNTASFVCLNYKDGSSQHQTLPPGPCPQGLRAQVIFPSCWNGKDLTSADHSHVVYPMGDNADNGPCPSTHNTRLPTLFYEFVWGVDGQDNTGNSTWVLANGDAEGYSFHADFIAAWNETILQDAIDQCAGNLFNDLESCPPLALTLERDVAAKCTANSTEAYKGTIDYLPGCNVIWNGPHAGKGLTPGCDPSKVMLKPPNWPAASASASSSALSASSTSASTSASSSPSSSASSSLLSSSSSSSSSALAAASPASVKQQLSDSVPKPNIPIPVSVASPASDANQPVRSSFGNKKAAPAPAHKADTKKKHHDNAFKVSSIPPTQKQQKRPSFADRKKAEEDRKRREAERRREEERKRKEEQRRKKAAQKAHRQHEREHRQK